jgi:hypothetical protein
MSTIRRLGRRMSRATSSRAGAGALARPVPIFVISYNRGDTLQQTVDSYMALSDEVEIVIHDNGSDDPATLASLQEMRRAGMKVVNAPKIHGPKELNLVNETVRAHFGGTPSSRYVVTDCDVDMSIASADALAVYSEILDELPEAACVGPMLRIRDIPSEYPLFNRVMNRHIEQFWQQSPQWIQISTGKLAILRAPFDTTFALHREGQDFRRRKTGVRVYEPYEARHLDWYVTELDTEADSYEHTSSDEISHWNNSANRALHAQVALEHTHLLYVERDERGNLTTRRLDL